MATLGNGTGSDYPGTIDTAEQQIDGASGTDVDAKWGNDVTSAITAIENELGTDPAGSLATVATRLSTLIAAAGGITSGTTANRPVAASGTFRLYWNTSLNRLEVIKDDATVTSVAGVTDHGALTGLGDDDHTIYSLANGTRTFTGPVNEEKATPYFQLAGTEASAQKYGIKEDAGVLYIALNTNTIASPTWTDLVSITSAGVVTALIEDVVARDTVNSNNASLVNHRARHRVKGSDPTYTNMQIVSCYGPMLNYGPGGCDWTAAARFKTNFTIENSTYNAKYYGVITDSGQLRTLIQGSAATATTNISVLGGTIAWVTGSANCSAIGGEVEIIVQFSGMSINSVVVLSGISSWIS